MISEFFLGVISGVLVTGVFRFWYHWDRHVSAQFEELLSTIREATQTGTDYWCRGHRDKSIPMLEARLVGLQQRIEGMLQIVDFSALSLGKLAMDERVQFFDALTGGKFGENARPRDEIQALKVETTAAQLLIKIWDRRKRTMTPVRWLNSFLYKITKNH